jgi:hypothetical protein
MQKVKRKKAAAGQLPAAALRHAVQISVAAPSAAIPNKKIQ